MPLLEQLAKLSFLQIAQKFLGEVTTLGKQLLKNLPVEQQYKDKIQKVLDSDGSFLEKAKQLGELRVELDEKVRDFQKNSSNSYQSRVLRSFTNFPNSLASAVQPSLEVIELIPVLEQALRLADKLQKFPLVQNAHAAQELTESLAIIAKITDTQIDAEIKKNIDDINQPLDNLESLVERALKNREIFFHSTDSNKPENTVNQLLKLEIELNEKIESFNKIKSELTRPKTFETKKDTKAELDEVNKEIQALENYRKQYMELNALIKKRQGFINQLKKEYESDINQEINPNDICSSLSGRTVKTNKTTSSTLALIQESVKGFIKSIGFLQLAEMTPKAVESLQEFNIYLIQFMQAEPANIIIEEEMQQPKKDELLNSSMSAQNELLKKIQVRTNEIVIEEINNANQKIDGIFSRTIKVNSMELCMVDKAIEALKAQKKFLEIKKELLESPAYLALQTYSDSRGLKAAVISKYLNKVSQAITFNQLYDAIQDETSLEAKAMRTNTGTGLYQFQFWKNNGGRSTADTLAIRLNKTLVGLVKEQRKTAETQAIQTNAAITFLSPMALSA